MQSKLLPIRKKKSFVFAKRHFIVQVFHYFKAIFINMQISCMLNNIFMLSDGKLKYCGIVFIFPFNAFILYKWIDYGHETRAYISSSI